jgi:uncharacterized protein (TIGR00159 family)
MLSTSLFNLLREIGVNGFVDIAVMSLLIYMALIGFKRTRAGVVLKGMVIIAASYLVAHQFNLILLTKVLEKFFAAIAIMLIVVFQEELRRFFEFIASWGGDRRQLKARSKLSPSESVSILVKTANDLARERVGALVVIKGKDFLDRHLTGGVALNGELSEEVLKSIFDPHSTGHDGAVIIEGSRIRQFAAHLPLSRNSVHLKNYGTRHAAALGISELSDALAIIISEEKGIVSVARHGELHKISTDEALEKLIGQFYEEKNPSVTVKPWEEIWKKNFREKLYALILAVGLWIVLVFGAQQTFKSVLVPVQYTLASDRLDVAQSFPKSVELTLSGPRKALYFTQPKDIQMLIDLKLKAGRQIVDLHSSNFTVSKSLAIENIEPNRVTVIVEQRR